MNFKTNIIAISILAILIIGSIALQLKGTSRENIGSIFSSTTGSMISYLIYHLILHNLDNT